jgi:tRNA 2-thiouridine synthesizing protein D
MEKLNYCLVVRASPQQQSQALSALLFAQAVLAAGHCIERVFFYQQGVLTANALRTPAQDALNITQQWQTLQTSTGLELCVCIAAALHQGIVNAEEAQRYGLTADNLATGFVLAGLGQLAIATADCDRIITFGGGA